MSADDLVRYTLAREPGAAPLDRAELYRELTRSIHHDILKVAFPRTLELIGQESMNTLLEDFLEAGGPTTLQYPRVPDDFIEWASRAEHPYADLLDYERATVRAERHPAQIDHMRPPADDDRMMLNPTLQVSSYTRPVHEISRANPEPPTQTNPLVYLAWRSPETDVVARQRLGLVVGRCLGLIGAEALTLEEWLSQSLRQESGGDPDAMRTALLETHRDLINRSGLFALE